MNKEEGTISGKSKRIVRNTALLYVRLFILMFVGLFTSRIILRNLGVEDYGIWNAVGGLASVFTVISGSITTSIIRYIAFALGQNDEEKIKAVFSASIRVQRTLALIIFVIAEAVGLWYLNCKMNIPPDRLQAANWVFQATLIILCINLMSMPYNSLIIAHEHMDAFAYIGILEGVLKLGVAILIMLSPVDKLKSYALLMLCVAIIVRLSYSLYCRRHFPESRERVRPGRELLAEMMKFAGWNFLGNATAIINTHGVNLLVNNYFGVTMNAARGVATQAEGTVLPLVNNVTNAINPQITKSYAAGDRDYSFHLVCRGAKYTTILSAFIIIPVFFEADILLRLWLGTVPDWAAVFTRLALLAVAINSMGNTLGTIEQATGDVKRYYILTSLLCILVFPITWVLYSRGLPAMVSYIVYSIIYFLLVFLKLYILKGQIGFPVGLFLKEVLARIAYAVIPAVAASYLVWTLIEPGVVRLLAVLATSTLSLLVSTYFLALGKGEKSYVAETVKKVFKAR